MRPLKPEEKTLTQKAIKKFQEELEYQQYLQQHAQLMYHTGITQNYKLQLTEYRIKLRETGERITELQHQINKLNDQLTRGVEEKNG